MDEKLLIKHALIMTIWNELKLHILRETDNGWCGRQRCKFTYYPFKIFRKLTSIEIKHGLFCLQVPGKLLFVWR